MIVHTTFKEKNYLWMTITIILVALSQNEWVIDNPPL